MADDFLDTGVWHNGEIVSAEKLNKAYNPLIVVVLDLKQEYFDSETGNTITNTRLNKNCRLISQRGSYYNPNYTGAIRVTVNDQGELNYKSDPDWPVTVIIEDSKISLFFIENKISASSTTDYTALLTPYSYGKSFIGRDGLIYLSIPRIDITSSTPNLTSYDNMNGGVLFSDKNGKEMGSLRIWAYNNPSEVQGYWGITRIVNGTEYRSHITQILNADGSTTYRVSDPKAFRSAIKAPTFIYFDTVSASDVYNKLTTLNVNDVALCYVAGEVIKAMTGRVDTSGNVIHLKGIVTRPTSNVFEFLGLGSTPNELFSFRITNPSSSSYGTTDFKKTFSGTSW